MGVKELRFSLSANFSCLLLNSLISPCEEKGFRELRRGIGKGDPWVCCVTCCCVTFNVLFHLPFSHSQCFSLTLMAFSWARDLIGLSIGRGGRVRAATMVWNWDLQWDS